MLDSAAILHHVPAHPARSFKEACQAFYLFQLALQLDNGSGYGPRLLKSLLPLLQTDISAEEQVLLALWDCPAPATRRDISEKLTAILVVAFLAMMALRLARSNGIRWFAFLGALGWVFFIAKLAVYKQASLFG